MGAMEVVEQSQLRPLMEYILHLLWMSVVMRSSHNLWRSNEVHSGSFIPLYEEFGNRFAENVCQNPARAAEATATTGDGSRRGDEKGRFISFAVSGKSQRIRPTSQFAFWPPRLALCVGAATS